MYIINVFIVNHFDIGNTSCISRYDTRNAERVLEAGRQQKHNEVVQVDGTYSLVDDNYDFPLQVARVL